MAVDSKGITTLACAYQTCGHYSYLEELLPKMDLQGSFGATIWTAADGID